MEIQTEEDIQAIIQFGAENYRHWTATVEGSAEEKRTEQKLSEFYEEYKTTIHLLMIVYSDLLKDMDSESQNAVFSSKSFMRYCRMLWYIHWTERKDG